MFQLGSTWTWGCAMLGHQKATPIDFWKCEPTPCVTSSIYAIETTRRATTNKEVTCPYPLYSKLITFHKHLHQLDKLKTESSNSQDLAQERHIETDLWINSEWDPKCPNLS